MALALMPKAEFQDTLAGLDRSMEDYAAGRWITAEEMSQRLKAHVTEIRAVQKTSPT